MAVPAGPAGDNKHYFITLIFFLMKELKKLNENAILERLSDGQKSMILGGLGSNIGQCYEVKTNENCSCGNGDCNYVHL